MRYAEVIVPLPLHNTFTYAIPDDMQGRLHQGDRVIVSFGPKKYYTGIIYALTDVAPQGFEVKEISMLLDEAPIVTHSQIRLWEWIADYYLCSMGDVYKAAVPSGLKIESESFIELNPDGLGDDVAEMTDREMLIVQHLNRVAKHQTIAEIEKATGLKNVGVAVMKMLEKGYVIVSEKLVERYRAQKIACVRPLIAANNPTELQEAFANVKRSKNQEKALLTLLQLSGAGRKNAQPLEVTMSALLERAGVTRPIVNELAKKGIVEIYNKVVNRFKSTEMSTESLPTLSDAQSQAFDEIGKCWQQTPVTLLHGVTSSGKTEIYIHLIDQVLRQGRQALYLVPEIALTTQLTHRLQRVFGEKVIIYHSKFTDNERVDIWKRMLSNPGPCVVVGARSSLFLPFSMLGLVIVDEEHESSYKQQDPAPRYNGRDCAIVLAQMFGAKTLLGSATPAIDTYYKASTGRYGLVTLSERYAGVAMPEMKIVDMSLERRNGAVKGIFSSQLESIVKDAIADHKAQAILFLNRRGYAPMALCKMCGNIPKCVQCDVSLTYHRRLDKLVCHYCGSQYPLPPICPACKEPTIEVVGYGTERVEDEVTEVFPDARIARMDLDTTRAKDGYDTLITDFSQHKYDILVGTQMVTKGLDFDLVRAVGIVNADAMINIPDFRSTERAFNMMEQVAGRAGRRDAQGVVAIQTSQPANPIFNFVVNHDYLGFYESEVVQRERYLYPPFTRLIYIYLKHRDPRQLDELAASYAAQLRVLFGNRVFGPEEPSVARVQSLYIRKIMLKIETNASMKKVRAILRNLYEQFATANPRLLRATTIYYDVDPV